MKEPIFLLEIVDHQTSEVVRSDKGRAWYLGAILQEILSNLPENCGVIINRDD